MSRGFVREDDQEEIPFVQPRAHLPENESNWVTNSGMNALLVEKEELLNEIKNLKISNENERRIAINHINSKLVLLEDRISSAKIIDLKKQPPEIVRFGATITLKIGTDIKPQKYQIVGVDEANIRENKISFISPIAQLLINKKVGDTAVLKLANGERIFEIIKIEY